MIRSDDTSAKSTKARSLPTHARMHAREQTKEEEEEQEEEEPKKGDKMKQILK